MTATFEERASTLPPRELLAAPAVAWPTIALALGALVLGALSFGCGAAGLWPLWVSALVNGICAYAAFTPAHDATHRSIARARWINDAAGRMGALLLAAPFSAFRRVHLAHHRYTNEPGRDPDLWSAGGPAWARPLRWLTQDLHYHALTLRAWSGLKGSERLVLAAEVGALLALFGGLIGFGLGAELLLLWLLPSRVAIGLLAWSFDYVPHRPHAVTAKADRLKATHVIEGPGLTWLLLCQDVHLIHHLYPGVPFYKMPAIWRHQRARLLAEGARIAPLFGARPFEDAVTG